MGASESAPVGAILLSNPRDLGVHAKVFQDDPEEATPRLVADPAAPLLALVPGSDPRVDLTWMTFGCEPPRGHLCPSGLLAPAS
jgi:hypothetical protein